MYEFTIIAVIANVPNQFEESLTGTFRVTWTEDMAAVMSTRFDGEYLYPMRIEPGD